MDERETNYTISESFTLPSKGKIYDREVNATVELRSMTARDEMKRLNPSSTPLKTLADIIEGCMVQKPNVHVYDMAMGDYEFLLHKLRSVTYGPEYKITVECPHCNELIDTTTNLDQLEVKTFSEAEFEALRNIILPVSNHNVKLNFQTPRMLDSIENKAKEMKRKAPGAGIHFETYAQLLLTIAEVDDKKLSSIELEYFIDSLPAKDMNRILSAFDKLSNYIGIDSSFTVSCTSCGEDINTFFRFGPEFFRPTED